MLPNALIDQAQRTIEDALAASSHPCVTCSFQAAGVVLVHMLIARHPRIPVVFLDTGYHFNQTMIYRDRIAAAWNLNLITLTPSLTVPQQESQFGLLHRSDPDRCCHLRKVEPLFAALENYDTWFTGLRRDQSKSRARLQVVDSFTLPTARTLQKISPLAGWSTQSVRSYLDHYSIPVLPLYEEGYTSIGCVPCTSLPPDPDDPRSGRWAGKKLECGIHIQA